MNQKTPHHDDALRIAQAAVQLMTDFHGQATPDDTPEMNAVFPAAAFKIFVDGHANLMYRLAQLGQAAGAAAAPVRTWRERIGAGPDFPLHAPTAVEQAMVAQIADLEAVIAQRAGAHAGYKLVPIDPKTGTMLHKAWLSLAGAEQPRCSDMCRIYDAMLAAAPAPAAIGCGGTGKHDDMPCLGCDACPRGGGNAQQLSAPTDWSECERIADLPTIFDALQGFSEDPTGDNGTMVVRAILEAITVRTVNEVSHG